MEVVKQYKQMASTNESTELDGMINAVTFEKAQYHNQFLSDACKADERSCLSFGK